MWHQTNETMSSVAAPVTSNERDCENFRQIWAVTAINARIGKLQKSIIGTGQDIQMARHTHQKQWLHCLTGSGMHSAESGLAALLASCVSTGSSELEC